MKHFYYFIIVAIIAGCNKSGNSTTAPGTVKITFINKVKNSPLILNTQHYTNTYGEDYTISKFKYYISNIALSHQGFVFKENESYHLIDASNNATQTFSFDVPISHPYEQLSFILGVDSTRNVSGAQTGALDPANGMFWTWNSGYIMAKLEGTSPASPAINNKIEYHIGGFSGSNSALRQISINLAAIQTLAIQSNHTSEIIIEADIDAWWQNPNSLKFAENPVCTTPGELAKKCADNYAKMFTLKTVTNF